MMAAPEAVAAAPADPSQWSIPQGEDATRRHIRDGLKAGDVDPVTGRAILNYHDPMVPGKNFDAPGQVALHGHDAGAALRRRRRGRHRQSSASARASSRTWGCARRRCVEGTLAAEVAAVGSVAWNERDQVLLQARATGFVEKLHRARRRSTASPPVRRWPRSTCRPGWRRRRSTWRWRACRAPTSRRWSTRRASACGWPAWTRRRSTPWCAAARCSRATRCGAASAAS